MTFSGWMTHDAVIHSTICYFIVFMLMLMLFGYSKVHESYMKSLKHELQDWGGYLEARS